MALLRLDRLLSDMGVASRRELREIIRSGRGAVNGQTASSPELKVDAGRDAVSLDGAPLRYSPFHYFMLDKPCGCVTATEDAGQRTVMELLTPEMRRMGLFPVGRLDKDTSGLLLLTDDGDFAHRVISPKSCVEKRYYARVEGAVTVSDEKAFQKGLVLRDGTRCLPAKLERLSGDECVVTVMEGKYHQVRRMLASREKTVLELRRLSIGALILDESLGPGGFREMTKDDLCRVFSPYIMEN